MNSYPKEVLIVINLFYKDNKPTLFFIFGIGGFFFGNYILWHSLLVKIILFKKYITNHLKVNL